MTLLLGSEDPVRVRDLRRMKASATGLLAAAAVLYLVTFCLPRFLDQTFDEKLVTVFHELFHMNPVFDGDLRRHPGRYAVHSHSKARYDSHMAELSREYVEDHPVPDLFEFLRTGYRELWDRHGGITGLLVPRPKLLPVGWATARSAARSQEGRPGS